MKMPSTICQNFTTATAEVEINGQSRRWGQGMHARKSSSMTVGLWKFTIFTGKRPRRRWEGERRRVKSLHLHMLDVS
jgi:hypothetical protein